MADVYACSPIGLMISSWTCNEKIFLFIFGIRSRENHLAIIYSPTWTCGGVAIAYITACETSSEFKNGIFGSNSNSSGLNISVFTAPGLMLYEKKKEKRKKQAWNWCDWNACLHSKLCGRQNVEYQQSDEWHDAWKFEMKKKTRER